MIHVTIYKNHDQEYEGFDSVGHAGYAPAGEDIVCAGVSALVLNTVNSIEAFTHDKYELKTKEESGLISFRFQGAVSDAGRLLMKSLFLGLQGIQESYGDEYISFLYKEV